MSVNNNIDSVPGVQVSDVSTSRVGPGANTVCEEPLERFHRRFCLLANIGKPIT